MHAQATRPCSCMRASDKHSSFQKVWYSGLALAAEAGLTRNARATLTPGKISPWPSDAPLWPSTVWLWAISSNLAFCVIAHDRGTGRDYSFLKKRTYDAGRRDGGLEIMNRTETQPPGAQDSCASPSNRHSEREKRIPRGVTSNRPPPRAGVARAAGAKTDFEGHSKAEGNAKP